MNIKTIIKVTAMAAVLIISAAALMTPVAAQENCVSDALRADVRTYAGETWRTSPGHVERWTRVLAAFGENNAYSSNPMTVSEAQAQANRGLQRWVPIPQALTCLAQAPEPEPEVEVVVVQPETVQPLTAEVTPASVNLPTYPAPTAHSGWFGWNAPKGNQIRRVTGSGPVPAQCATKANKVRQDIIDNNWHISTMRKHWYELHTDRRSWWFSTVKNIGCNVKQSWDDPDGYAKCVGIGDRTAYNQGGPNGEASGQWQWTRAPLPSIYAAQGAYASYDDWGNKNPQPVQYGVLQCGTASEQTGGSGPTASLNFRVPSLLTTHTLNEGDAAVEISSNLRDASGYVEYTVVFGEGTAKMGVDYKVEMRGRYKYYDSDTFRSRSSWQEVNPNHSRMRVQLSNGTGFHNIRITPLTDSLRGEGPETVIVKFEKPTPQINTLSYKKSYCARHANSCSGRGCKPACLEQTGDHYELSSMTGSGFHGYQPWSDPAKRQVTLTINDRAGGNTLAGVDKSVTVNSIELVEGTKAPELRRGCRGRFGFSDQEWCSGYHTILTWTAPNHVCIYGALEMTGGNTNPGFARGDLGDFNGSSVLRDRATGVGRTHILCGSGSKQVYLRTHSDSHNEGTETANITFKVDRVLEETQWLRPSSVHVTPGVLTITNDGPLPKEWLARYGHVVASDTVDAVSDRVKLDRTPGDATVELGAVPIEGEAIYDESVIIEGSTFNVTSQDRNGATVSAWGKVTASSFNATVGDMSLSGDTTYGMAGVDYAANGWMFGVGFGHANGEGTTSTDYMIDSGLMTVFPYGSITMGNTQLWSTVGYGEGDINLKRTTDMATEDLGTADTTWMMAAVGARSKVTDGDNLDLSVVGDAFWTGIDSEKVAGFESSESSSHRERVGLEADLQWDALTMTPTVFARMDGGDVGSETSVELEGDLRWEVLQDLTVSGSGSHVLDSENEFRSYSLGLEWSTQYGTPSLSYTQEDIYTLGWRKPFKGGSVGIETRPQNESAHMSLNVVF